jgi:Peptidase family M23
MRLTYLTAMTLLLITHLLIPVVLIYWTWTRQNFSGMGWLWQILTFALYLVFIFLVGSWALVSFYLRYAFPALFIVAGTLSYFRAKTLPFWPEKSIMAWTGIGAGWVIAGFLIFFIVGAMRSYYFDEKPVDLAFPLKNGVYAVFEGGNGKASSLMNYHYGGATHQRAGVNRSMKYAVDITKLSIWGNDAHGFLPKENEKYVIFNEVVYSPCEGQVFDVIDQWPNETPWGDKAPYNVGNRIVIQSGDFLVLMGHLQRGSIQVKAGERVKKGQPIAKVGNSGWTQQPHLHIQAMKMSTGSFWSGEGLPIYLDGKNAVKNTLFFKGP